MKKFIGAIFGLLIAMYGSYKRQRIREECPGFHQLLKQQVAELNQNRSLDKITRQQKFMKLVEEDLIYHGLRNLL